MAATTRFEPGQVWRGANGRLRRIVSIKMWGNEIKDIHWEKADAQRGPRNGTSFITTWHGWLGITGALVTLSDAGKGG